MKKCLSVLLCACVALSALAGDRVITRAHLKMAKKNAVPASTLPVASVDKKTSLTLDRYMQQRHLTLNDNRLNGESGHVMGEKIIKADTYDFDWDSVRCVASVVDTSFFIKGKMSALTHRYSSLSLNEDENVVYLADFYDEFHIPIDVDSINGIVTLRTGVLLDTITGIYDESSWGGVADRGTSYTRITRRIYAMPEAWLTDETLTSYDDIYGTIYWDGSIAMQGGFGFLVEQVETRVVSGVEHSSTVYWGLSPIYRNLYMFTPNAVHEYQGEYSAQLVATLNVDFVAMVSYLLEPCGPTGGVVQRPVKPRPVKPKPVNPRPFKQTSLCAPAADGDMTLLLEPRPQVETRIPEASPLYQPVYMYQDNDSTILVYNLYGKDYSWNYLILHPDGTMTLPSQEMDRSSSRGEAVYNCSVAADSIVLDNEGTVASGGVITWGDTYFFGESGLHNNHYWNNKLYLADGASFEFIPAPVISASVVTDSTVVFTAVSGRSDATVYLYEYDPVEYVYLGDGTDAYTATRGSEPRTVYLCAYAEVFNGNDYVYSDFTELAYEVPAFFMPGDVNGDRTVSIADITMLIDYLLDEEPGSITAFHPGEADVNRDSMISIADVACLIDHILSLE